MDRIPKYGLPVRVSIMGETADLLGVVYVRQEQRVIDMLCDARPFFPLQTKERLVLVNKAAVSLISMLERAQVEQALDMFPGVNLAALNER
ncbi:MULTISPECIES: hypothetical protein [unclassified Yoonia]|uniref:DUF6812 domain-containing protein n=1 Tax=unclassified Yoonia TaxID=2629118 RepID=UPI002AFFA0CB|nr:MULTISPECIES: hypothetical protein [unclassified Yoonia]